MHSSTNPFLVTLHKRTCNLYLFRSNIYQYCYHFLVKCRYLEQFDSIYSPPIYVLMFLYLYMYIILCVYMHCRHREKRCAAVFLLLFIALVSGIFVKHRILHTQNWSFVSHLHLSHLPALCFLCSMLIIGCSTTLTCFLQQTTIEIVFTKIVSTLFFFF